MPTFYADIQDARIMYHVADWMEQLAAALYEREVAVNFSCETTPGSTHTFRATRFTLPNGTQKSQPVAADFHDARGTSTILSFIARLRYAIEVLIAVNPAPVVNGALLNQAPTWNAYYRTAAFARYTSVDQFLAEIGYDSGWFEDPDVVESLAATRNDVWVFRAEVWEQMRDALLHLRWYHIVVYPATQALAYDPTNGGSFGVASTTGTASEAEYPWDKALEGVFTTPMPPDDFVSGGTSVFGAMIGYRIANAWLLLCYWQQKYRTRLTYIENFRGTRINDWTWSWGVQADNLRIPGSTPANSMEFTNSLGETQRVYSNTNDGYTYMTVPRTTYSHGPGVKEVGGDPYIDFWISDPATPPVNQPFQTSEYPGYAGAYDLRARAVVGPAVVQQWHCDAFSYFGYQS